MSSISIEKILPFILEKDKLIFNKSFQSIDKRTKYCVYHYDEFLKDSNENSLKLERLGADDIRIRYEANALAFLNNLHSLIDAFPYILNIIFKEYEIDAGGVRWNDYFLKKYKKYNFFDNLNKIYENEEFLQLKGLVNQTKHKHLLSIKNDFENLFFEEIIYKFQKKTLKIENVNVKEFIVKLHDNLIPQLFELYESIINEKISL